MIKHSISTLFFLFLVSTFVQGQSSLGLKAGVNLANQSIEGFFYDTLKFDQITGLVAGLQGDIEISEFFSIQTEGLLVQKGRKSLTELNLGSINFTQESISRINYLEIPVLAKLKLGNDNFKGYAFAGPSFAFALTGKEEVTTNGGANISTEKKEIDFSKSNYNRYEIGGHLGFGLSFNFGSFGLFSDIRYLLGFNNLDLSEEDVTIKNKGIALTGGVFIPFSD